MKTFLVTKGLMYTYDDLLFEINQAESYCFQFKSDDLYIYFLNLIKALVHNKPLVLIDSDINLAELENLDEKFVNVCEPLQNKKFSTINEIIKSVENSKSEISLFTSGTTGQPKKVIHSIRSLIRNVRKSNQYENDVWAFAYNPTHMAGLQVFFQAFLNSNSIINVFNHSRDEIYKLVEKFSITHISGTPTFYRMLLPFEKSFISIKRVTLGGEKSDSKLHHFIKQIFPEARINNIYASTEAGALFSAKGEYFQIPAAIQDKIKVLDNELFIHKSLLGQSESFVLKDDYYRTGDIIEWVDIEKGLFCFKGRANELLNIGGYKVNPSEIESIISQLPNIVQVIVYGKSNSVLGNILCADIILESGYEITEFSIRQHLKALVQDYKIPRRIKFVDTIKTTRTGKLKRA